MDISTILIVKSNNKNYKKEVSNLKNNTVRIVSAKEDKDLLREINYIKYIKIINSTEKQLFCYKDIKDITRYVQDGIIIYIFTWEV